MRTLLPLMIALLVAGLDIGLSATVRAATAPASCERLKQAALFLFLDASCKPIAPGNDEGALDEAAHMAIRACGAPIGEPPTLALARGRRSDAPRQASDETLDCFSLASIIVEAYRKMYPGNPSREDFLRTLRRAVDHGTTGDSRPDSDTERRFGALVRALARTPTSSAATGWDVIAQHAFDVAMSYRKMPPPPWASEDLAAEALVSTRSGSFVEYVLSFPSAEAHSAWRADSHGLPFAYTATTPAYAMPGNFADPAHYLLQRSNIALITDPWLIALDAARTAPDASVRLAWISQSANLQHCTSEALLDRQIEQVNGIRNDEREAEFLVTWLRGVPVGILRFHIEHQSTRRKTIRIDYAMTAPTMFFAPQPESTPRPVLSAAIQRLSSTARRLGAHEIRIAVRPDVNPAFMHAIGFQVPRSHHGEI